MHFMTDIETFGQGSHSPVIELAVVPFDKKEVHKGFFAPVRPDFNKSIPEADTIAWWFNQDVPCPVDMKSPDFPTVLSRLAGWLGKSPIDGVWANDPSFDLVVLHNLARAHDMEMPWTHKHYRAFRTFKQFGIKLGIERMRPEKEHNALADAVAQAWTVIHINKALIEKGVGIL